MPLFAIVCSGKSTKKTDTQSLNFWLAPSLRIVQNDFLELANLVFLIQAMKKSKLIKINSDKVNNYVRVCCDQVKLARFFIWIRPFDVRQAKSKFHVNCLREMLNCFLHVAPSFLLLHFIVLIVAMYETVKSWFVCIRYRYILCFPCASGNSRIKN